MYRNAQLIIWCSLLAIALTSITVTQYSTVLQLEYYYVSEREVPNLPISLNTQRLQCMIVYFTRFEEQRAYWYLAYHVGGYAHTWYLSRLKNFHYVGLWFFCYFSRQEMHSRRDPKNILMEIVRVWYLRSCTSIWRFYYKVSYGVLEICIRWMICA